jgi:hypothetical protein
VSQIPGVPDHAAPEYEVVDPGTVEPKTKAATVAGAGSAAIITPAVVLLADELFYGGGPIDVPLPYVGVIGLIVTGLCTFAASYSARHVNR